MNLKSWLWTWKISKTCEYQRKIKTKINRHCENFRTEAGSVANALHFDHISQLSRSSDQKGKLLKRDNRPKMEALVRSPLSTNPVLIPNLIGLRLHSSGRLKLQSIWNFLIRTDLFHPPEKDEVIHFTWSMPSSAYKSPTLYSSSEPFLFVWWDAVQFTN